MGFMGKVIGLDSHDIVCREDLKVSCIAEETSSKVVSADQVNSSLSAGYTGSQCSQARHNGNLIQTF